MHFLVAAPFTLLTYFAKEIRMVFRGPFAISFWKIRDSNGPGEVHVVYGL